MRYIFLLKYHDAFAKWNIGNSYRALVVVSVVNRFSIADLVGLAVFQILIVDCCLSLLMTPSTCCRTAIVSPYSHK